MERTPRGSRLHIAIVGRRNSGKSSLINTLTNQNVAIVSPVAGTTTDPVYKSIELLPLGPIVLIDTPGLDDTGELGNLRIQKTKEILQKADLIILLVDINLGLSYLEEELISLAKEKNIPVITVFNKLDLVRSLPDHTMAISCKTKEGIPNLIKKIIELAPQQNKKLIGDFVNPGDLFILVTPIDSAAPKNRLIMPQVLTLRDILDHYGVALVLRETELASTLASLQTKPKMVITDSQVFPLVDKETPRDIPLTSFSILMARYKGELPELISGINTIKKLKTNNQVLIAEACSHHQQEEDIGTIKIPLWLEEITGKSLHFTWVKGGDFPEDLTPFKLIIHCGGCMLNEKEMLARITQARQQNIHILNYGTMIAYRYGILNRALRPFQI